MATAENVLDATELQENLEQQNVVVRVTNLPLDQVSAACTSAKESLQQGSSVCEIAEQGVETPAAEPIVDKLEPQTASECVCKGLDKLEEKLPILHHPTDQVLAETKVLVTSTANVKESVMGVVDMTTTTAVQNLLERSKTVGQLVVTSMDTTLLKSELLDHHLPMTKEELGKVAVPTEGTDPATLQDQSCCVHSESLISKALPRANQYSIGKMKQAKQNGQETLSPLHKLVDLLKVAEKEADSAHVRLQVVQATLHEILSDQKKPDEKMQVFSKKPELLESQSLAMTRSLFDQLQTICETLASNVCGLPQHIEEQVQHICKWAAEMSSTLSSATSYQDLSVQFLAQSKEQLMKIHDKIDEMMD